LGDDEALVVAAGEGNGECNPIAGKGPGCGALAGDVPEEAAGNASDVPEEAAGNGELRAGAAAEGGSRNFAKMFVAAWTSELDCACEGT